MRANIHLLFAVIIFCNIYSYGQGVAINDDGSVPDPSAILDLKSTSKGLLLPRMNDQQINNITSPVAGLVVYSTTLQKPVYYDGNNWLLFDGTLYNPTFPLGSVFVSQSNGTDQETSGTMESPYNTITYALDRAVANGNSNVLVAEGNYNESVDLRNGVNLLGGYELNWERNLGFTHTIISGSTIIDGHIATITANNITDPTIFEGFDIAGSNSNSVGKNSYAIYINTCSSNLIIRYNEIDAGNGSDGNDGTNGIVGLGGQDGLGRDYSPIDYDAYITASSPCSDFRQHDNGGFLIVGSDNISGGNGGGNNCPPIQNIEASGIDGYDGQLGSGPRDGSRGLGGDAGDDGLMSLGYCILPPGQTIGLDGTNGGEGQNGSGGDGGSNTAGTVQMGHWISMMGSNGENGGHGGGGGGGGAGGGGECSSMCEGDKLGGHGGGGGSGGGGGEAGFGGFGGGGSFGIFILNGSVPVIEYNTIALGNGGRGGDGGTGGPAGTGGDGGAGGLCPGDCSCYKSAGAGGNGGNGGHGGGGGGSCGGNSYGIYTSGVSGSPNYNINNMCSGGAGGQDGNGGYSPGNSGSDGINGIVVNFSNN